MNINEYAEKLVQVMQAEGVTVEVLREGAPVGFWKLVAIATGQTHAAARIYWHKHKAKLPEMLKQVMVDNVGEQATPSTPAIVDNLARDSLSAEIVKHDKLDIREAEGLSPAIVDKVDTVEIPHRSADSATAIVDKHDIPEHGAIVDNFDTPESGDYISDKVAKNDIVTREELTRMMEDMESRLMQAIDEKLSTSEIEERKGVMVDIFDNPPLPPKIGPAGKRYAGDKADIRARVDMKLFKLLEDEAKIYFGGNVSRALDAVLWRYYQKPCLSFEPSEASDEAHGAEHSE
jgi:hypothetical protein